MTNILYIVSNINKSLSFEWIEQRLDKHKYSLQFILINQQKSELYTYLQHKGCPVQEHFYSNKFGLVSIFLKVLFYQINNRPDVVHTHLLEANIIGLTTAWFLGIKKRIFTRHHALVHYVDYPKGIFWDKWCNTIATHIIAVSNNVRNILVRKDGTPSDKVHVIRHGFDLAYFDAHDLQKVKSIRKKYVLDKKKPVIGVISRHVHWKGIQYIIPAFEKLLTRYPDAILVLANAQGEYSNVLNKMLEKLPTKSYRQIVFEQDLSSLYQCFDLYVHTPIDTESEAFGQTYVEALACGIPSVVTLSGIANDFIMDEKNALVIPHKNSEEIYSAMMRLIEDGELKNKIVQEGKDSVARLFQVKKMIDSLEQLYARA